MCQIKCRVRQRTISMDFCTALSRGWPKCHEQTMELQTVTRGEIAKGVARAMAPRHVVRKALREVR